MSRLTRKVVENISQRAIKNRWNKHDAGNWLVNQGYSNVFRPNSEKLTTSAVNWMNKYNIPSRTHSEASKKNIQILHEQRKLDPEFDAAWRAGSGAWTKNLVGSNRQPTFEETQRAVAKNLGLDKTDPLVNLTLQTKRVDDILNPTPVGIEKLVDKYNVGSMVKGYENFAATRNALNKELFGSESFKKLLNDLNILSPGRMAFGTGHQLPTKLALKHRGLYEPYTSDIKLAQKIINPKNIKPELNEANIRKQSIEKILLDPKYKDLRDKNISLIDEALGEAQMGARYYNPKLTSIGYEGAIDIPRLYNYLDKIKRAGSNRILPTISSFNKGGLVSLLKDKSLQIMAKNLIPKQFSILEGGLS